MVAVGYLPVCICRLRKNINLFGLHSFRLVATEQFGGDVVGVAEDRIDRTELLANVAEVVTDAGDCFGRVASVVMTQVMLEREGIGKCADHRVEAPGEFA